MSKSKPAKRVARTTTSRVENRSRNTGAGASRPKQPLIFDRNNYYLMLAGIGLVALGLVLMSGGAMPSPEVWDDSIIFSKRRTLVGPFVIFLGLVVEIFAIFHRKQTPSLTAEPSEERVGGKD
ncbi:MAG: hypothetical protein RLY31_2508 [Bacteroidota bacterium]|jgi:uncharacterized membrane protein